MKISQIHIKKITTGVVLTILAGAYAQAAEDIPVVSIKSTTGTTAFAGALFQSGIRLAVEEVNAKGGVRAAKINLIDCPLNKAFEVAYKSRYGTVADGWSASGYSLAQVAIAALKEAGPNPTPEKVRDAYLKLKDVPVVVGSGRWNQNDRKPNYGAAVLAVKDGKFVTAPRFQEMREEPAMKPISPSLAAAIVFSALQFH